MTRYAFAVLSAAFVLSTSSLAAQTPAASSTRGFFIGAHLNGSAIAIEDAEFGEDEQSGGGAGLQLGYGFTERLALFIEGTAAGLEDEVVLAHADFGIRYSFTGPTRRWVPSVEAALTGRGLARDDADLEGGGTGDVSLTGGGFTLGVGLQYYTAPNWAIGIAAKWTGGEFTTFEVDNVSVDGFEIDATSTLFNIGLTWYPQAGR